MCQKSGISFKRSATIVLETTFVEKPETAFSKSLGVISEVKIQPNEILELTTL